MSKKYHKPNKLIAGLLIFGFSMLILGMLIMVDIKEGVLYPIESLAVFIGAIIGEYLILNTASYNDNKNKDSIKTRSI